MFSALFSYRAVEGKGRTDQTSEFRCPERLPVKELDMNNLNTVLIEGQLTRDPDQGSAPAQTQMCRLSIASNRYHLDEKGEWKQNPSYFTVHVYGSVAGACMAHLKKGRGVRVVGRLKQRSWLVDGIWHEKIYILAEHIEFQPVKKSEPASVQNPGGFYTKSDLQDIEDAPADIAQQTDPIAVPEVAEDIPACTIEPQDANLDIQENPITEEEETGMDDMPEEFAAYA